jgi:hypothetical protein
MTDRAGKHPGARLDDLLEMLDAADEGGLKLDTLMAYAVAGADLRTETLRDVMTEGSFSWEVAGELLDDRPAPFTRALDASIPGENIVLAVYSDKRGRWAAVQREANGRDYLSWGATEALARRAAALHAFRERPAARVDDDFVPVASIIGAAPPVEPRADEPPDFPTSENPLPDEPAVEKITRAARPDVPEWRVKF